MGSAHRLRAAGGWLFRQRSWLPVPFAFALIAIRWGAVRGRWPTVIGATLVVLGEALRLWSVRHIGTISRTRATRLGPLIATGPYLLTRNPLYVGNALLWFGFVAWSGLLWMEPIAAVLFAAQYGLLTRWEERLLLDRFERRYDAYRECTPRWMPRLANLSLARTSSSAPPWPAVLFSERGTLLAVAIMALLLMLKTLT